MTTQALLRKYPDSYRIDVYPTHRTAAAPQRVYDAPRSTAVARFLGERPMNLFENDGALAGIRAERVRLAPDGALRGRVARRERTGADLYLEVETARGSIVAGGSTSSCGTQAVKRALFCQRILHLKHDN